MGCISALGSAVHYATAISLDFEPQMGYRLLIPVSSHEA